MTNEEVADEFNYCKRQVERIRISLMKTVLKRLIEKQIPKKPSETDKARCIHCACVVNRSEKFCKNCGQALDWSDTE